MRRYVSRIELTHVPCNGKTHLVNVYSCLQLLDKSLRRGSKDNVSTVHVRVSSIVRISFTHILFKQMTSILVDLYKTEATTRIDYSESQDSTEIFDKENEKISGQNYLEQQLLQP